MKIININNRIRNDRGCDRKRTANSLVDGEGADARCVIF
jgi:hypothetical protein